MATGRANGEGGEERESKGDNEGKGRTPAWHRRSEPTHLLNVSLLQRDNTNVFPEGCDLMF